MKVLPFPVSTNILINTLVLLWTFLSPSTASAERQIVVSAAASLTQAFEALGEAFEREHPGVSLVFNFASSGSLLRQIDMGAPVDVFASADTFTMDGAENKGLIRPETRQNFAGNSLVLVVPQPPAVPVNGIEDFLEAGVTRMALGHPETVPAGRYARDVLQEQELWKPLIPKHIYGQSVRQVLDYIVRGEVDGGIVYRTDALLQGTKVTVCQALGSPGLVDYPIAVVKGSGEEETALTFIAYLRSRAGCTIFTEYGFECR
ncbi:MAG: molybdate ABC transporter substrate-binding protein [bacterium]|nr:molybdate ABC transporter substrate-binding protein [bacterium]